VDPFHARLARLALEVAADYGFCLAGGYAVQAHGFVDRVSKDVDLFTTNASVADFPAAQAAVVTALKAHGLAVTVEREGATFARLMVADPGSSQTSTLELGVDWRAFPPVQLAIGPVLHPVDAAANKLCALFGRAAVRGLHRRTCSAQGRALHRSRARPVQSVWRRSSSRVPLLAR
jgi:Nucleotidyl transferase AbiEii toxin, Type IV TA system